MKPGMKVKMGPKSFSGIDLLDQGQKVDESPIHGLCAYINQRLDCADFRLATLLRCLYRYRHLLSEKTIAMMEETVQSFRYFMDEPGDDSMCFWSENHQILFASEAYLAGQLYPDKVFSNSALTGRQLQVKAKVHILRWLKYRFLYGFSEWHSNTYYEEDVGALCLLIDFASEEEIRIKAKMILDLLLLDMAVHSWRGLFCAASGRCYEKQKKYPLLQDVLDISQAVWGFQYKEQYDYSRLSSGFLLSRSYDLPQVIREIGWDSDTVVVQDSMGLDLSEIRQEFEDLKDFNTAGLFLWGMESFTNPESIELTLEMFDSWRLQNNSFLKDLSMVNKRILKRSGLLPMVVRILNPVTQGIAIQRANTYTYKTKYYMMSTAQAHHPGTFGDQQHIWQATLSPEVTVFTTHPAASAFDDVDRNFSPGYWVGNGILPYSVQHENVHISIYDLTKRKGFMEKERKGFTHAWFPAGKFDETVTEGRYLFGRLKDVYIMLAGRNPLEACPGNSSEWIQNGKVTYWICEIGTAEQFSDFKSFIQEMKSREIRFEEQSKTLIYKGEHLYEVTYGKCFAVDRQQLILDYPRLNSPYGYVERKPEEIRIEWKGYYMHLNFDKVIREHGIYT